MPRPAEIPDWMYPGTTVRDMHRESWLIEAVQFRGAEGFHVHLKPLGRGISGWFPVEYVARRYHPSQVSRYPTIYASELRDLAYRGLINVAIQFEEEQFMMVSLDGQRAMPYIVREINVNEGTRLVLEPQEVMEIDPDERIDLDLQGGVDAAIGRNPPPWEVEPPPPTVEPEPVRLVSVWERIAEMKRGPGAGPGGQPRASDPHSDTTPGADPEV